MKTDFELLMQFKREGLTDLMTKDLAERMAEELKAEGHEVVIINQTDCGKYWLSQYYF